jgi:hypothetical protein
VASDYFLLRDLDLQLQITKNTVRTQEDSLKLTQLRLQHGVAAGSGFKTAQELLRHANSRITFDVYTRAISATKREANNRVMEMVFEAGRKKLSAPSTDAKRKLKKVRIAPAPSKEVHDLLLAIKPLLS